MRSLPRKLFSALITWLIFLSFNVLNGLINSFHKEDIIFFTIITGFFSFLGIFGYGVVSSICIDFVVDRYIKKWSSFLKGVLYILFGMIGNAIFMNDLSRFLEFPSLPVIIAIIFFVIDEVLMKFKKKNK
ncbi:hypothetical protein [Lihuaxuella thermophila]|uniref:Uncharacterized protein n=1 Tax=Lihuaxuella thermophila TaxID=1173111 RepID=A0A1H8AUE6_9BACL|nr:hypothetical protein [Lihuaxuella thermophila]SEM74372.1 hypothetical protein SAMN05444955_101361 [Lihuaxuella thermophila]